MVRWRSRSVVRPADLVHPGCARLSSCALVVRQLSAHAFFGWGGVGREPGRAGVPMEVMGLMLGEFIDDYTVRVIDVFAMPQSGTGVSVEAVDPVFQTKMLDMLRQTGRYEGAAALLAARMRVLIQAGGGGCMGGQPRDGRRVVPLPPRLWLLAVGRRHQHPAGPSLALAPCRWLLPPRFGLIGCVCVCARARFLSAQSFEALNQRAVAVVIDPIQSVKGKVVIDAFRLISPQTIMMNQEPRQTTSNIGHLNKPSIQVEGAGQAGGSAGGRVGGRAGGRAHGCARKRAGARVRAGEGWRAGAHASTPILTCHAPPGPTPTRAHAPYYCAHRVRP